MASGKEIKGGVNFSGLLLLLFITLKLCGVIDWSWWWVMAPLWIPCGLVVLVLLVALPFCIWGGNKRG